MIILGTGRVGFIGSNFVRYMINKYPDYQIINVDEVKLGWKPPLTFKQGILETIHWYLENQEPWKRIKTGKYMQYYSNRYGECVYG